MSPMQSSGDICLDPKVIRAHENLKETVTILHYAFNFAKDFF